MDSLNDIFSQKGAQKGAQKAETSAWSGHLIDANCCSQVGMLTFVLFLFQVLKQPRYLYGRNRIINLKFDNHICSLFLRVIFLSELVWHMHTMCEGTYIFAALHMFMHVLLPACSFTTLYWISHANAKLVWVYLVIRNCFTCCLTTY